MMKGKGGFMGMILSVLGIVLVVSMFSTVMTSLGLLYGATGASNFIAFTTIVGISPTVLLLGSTLGAGFAYYRSYKSVGRTGSDTSGLMRMVLGVLEIILFVTLFSTILSNFNTLYSTYSSNTDWIAFGTVVSILPTVLFLGGIFAGGATAAGGWRARRARRRG